MLRPDGNLKPLLLVQVVPHVEELLEVLVDPLLVAVVAWHSSSGSGGIGGDGTLAPVISILRHLMDRHGNVEKMEESSEANNGSSKPELTGQLEERARTDDRRRKRMQTSRSSDACEVSSGKEESHLLDRVQLWGKEEEGRRS